jgi:predicted amidohydrolase
MKRKIKINGKSVLILPEYHLTDFPPQIALTSEEAYGILKEYEKYGFDVLISGYVERENDKNYSSVLFIDDGKTHNVRKSHLYSDEQEIISPNEAPRRSVELSIGKTLLVICNELKFLNDHEYQCIVRNEEIVNLLLISAMFYKQKDNTEQCLGYCKDHGIKRLITSDRFFGLEITEIDRISG